MPRSLTHTFSVQLTRLNNNKFINWHTFIEIECVLSSHAHIRATKTLNK